MTKEEKLEEAKRLYKTANADQKYVLESLFPELKESEDERIWIINYLSNRILNSTIIAEKENLKKAIAWLENQGEQNHADKVEPKFHEGDWVVSPNGVYWHIDAINNNRYEVSSTDGVCADWTLNTSLYRLWTIQDAKDGDVLSTEDWIFIFEKMNSNEKPVCHCHYDIELGFRTDANSYIATGSEIYPATKEQRDLLFTKMKEAGYEWDADKKELKKIAQNPAWSEEDEKLVKNLISTLSNLYARNLIEKETKEKYTNLLKSLKDRVQPKQEWSEEDELIINKILCICNDFEKSFEISPASTKVIKEDVDKIDNWLKSLRPQSTWKPSEEMLEALYRVIPENVMEKSEDEILLDKLYQGLKYGKVLSEK